MSAAIDTETNEREIAANTTGYTRTFEAMELYPALGVLPKQVADQTEHALARVENARRKLERGLAGGGGVVALPDVWRAGDRLLCECYYHPAADTDYRRPTRWRPATEEPASELQV